MPSLLTPRCHVNHHKLRDSAFYKALPPSKEDMACRREITLDVLWEYAEILWQQKCPLKDERHLDRWEVGVESLNERSEALWSERIKPLVVEATNHAALRLAEVSHGTISDHPAPSPAHRRREGKKERSCLV